MTKITIIDANPEQIKGEVPTIQCDSKYSLCKIDRNFIQENRNDRWWCSSEAYWFGAHAPEPEVSEDGWLPGQPSVLFLLLI